MKIETFQYEIKFRTVMILNQITKKSPSAIRKNLSNIYEYAYLSDAKYLLMEGFTNYELSDEIFYKDDVAYIANHTERLVINAYLLVTGRGSEIKDVETWIANRQSIFNNINYRVIQIKNLEYEIRKDTQKISSYIPFSWESAIKIAKQMKIKCYHKDSAADTLSFELGKIKCGDDEEGYINYQNIIIELDKKMKLHNIIYHFNKWKYNVQWGWYNTYDLHPHVSGYSLCEGNRQEDMTIYRSTQDWGFLLSTYRECFASYDSTSAYAKIKQIAPILRGMAKIADDIEYPEDISDSDLSYKIFKKMQAQKRRCRICDNIYYGEECDRENCIGNPLTKKLCTHCDREMTWKSHLHRVTCDNCYYCLHCEVISPNSTECLNIKCIKCKNYVIRCEHCYGIKSYIDGQLYCDNPKCKNHKDYITPIAPISESPVCSICHYNNLRQNGLLEWWCDNHNHSISQYDKYGAPIERDHRYFNYLRDFLDKICLGQVQHITGYEGAPIPVYGENNELIGIKCGEEIIASIEYIEEDKPIINWR